MDYSLAAVKMLISQLRDAKPTPSQNATALGGVLFQRAWLQVCDLSILSFVNCFDDITESCVVGRFGLRSGHLRWPYGPRRRHRSRRARPLQRLCPPSMEIRFQYHFRFDFAHFLVACIKPSRIIYVHRDVPDGGWCIPYSHGRDTSA